MNFSTISNSPSGRSDFPYATSSISKPSFRVYSRHSPIVCSSLFSRSSSSKASRTFCKFGLSISSTAYLPGESSDTVLGSIHILSRSLLKNSQPCFSCNSKVYWGASYFPLENSYIMSFVNDLSSWGYICGI